MSQSIIKQYIKLALDEDLGYLGDITTKLTIPKNHYSYAKVIFKSDGILAGIDDALLVFDVLSEMENYEKLKIIFKQTDGLFFTKDSVVLEIYGQTQLILTGERTFLNILQRMCGIATLTNKLVLKIKDFDVKITDTRKTTPNFRIFEKKAVKIGGGFNHRFGLFDGVLIKDNHIKAVGSITNAVKKVRQNIHHLLKIEVEVKNLDEVKEALNANVDVIMFDNMKIDEMKEAIKLISKKAICEISGGINEENLLDVAKLGADYISIGAITHSAKILDISLKITDSK